MNVHGFIVPSRVIGAVFLLIALVNAGLAVWFYSSTARFVRHAVRAAGTVVQVQPGDSKGGMYAVVEYADTVGVLHRTTSRWSSNPPAYSAGEKVNVFYDPANPNEVKIEGFLELWLIALVFAILTVPPAVGALIFLWLIPFTIRRVWPKSQTVQPPPVPQV